MCAFNGLAPIEPDEVNMVIFENQPHVCTWAPWNKQFDFWQKHVPKYRENDDASPWVHSAQLPSPMGFINLGDQCPVQIGELRWNTITLKLHILLVARNIRPYDVIAIGRRELEHFLQYISNDTVPFTLVTVNTDLPVTPELRGHVGALRPIQSWYAMNLMLGAYSDRIFPLPLGFHYHNEHSVLQREARVLEVRRRVVLGQIDKSPKILVTPMGRSNRLRDTYTRFLKEANLSFVDVIQKPIPRQQLMELMAKYTFVLSPPGWGYDCFRTWEIVAVGATPIVIDVASFDMRLFDGVQTWIVKSPRDIIDGYDAQLKKVRAVSLEVPDKLNMSWWRHIFRNVRARAVHTEEPGMNGESSEL